MNNSVESEKNIVLFIVEGEILDVDVIKNIEKKFIKNKVMVIPFKTNIYNLYTKLVNDNFDTDIYVLLQEEDTEGKIPVVSRDNIAEIHLFFDFDGHHYGTTKPIGHVIDRVQQMLTHFNDETDHGFLYISYPMIEAIQHFDGSEFDENKLMLKTFCANRGKDAEDNHYKKIACRNSIYYCDENESITDLEREDWEKISKYFIKSILYLNEFREMKDYNAFNDLIDSKAIFDSQINMFINKSNEVLILTGFPPFLIRYLGESFYVDLLKDISLCVDENISISCLSN